MIVTLRLAEEKIKESQVEKGGDGGLKFSSRPLFLAATFCRTIQ